MTHSEIFHINRNPTLDVIGMSYSRINKSFDLMLHHVVDWEKQLLRLEIENESNKQKYKGNKNIEFVVNGQKKIKCQRLGTTTIFSVYRDTRAHQSGTKQRVLAKIHK